MTSQLWTFEELLGALAGSVVLDGKPDAAITGFSIDTRSLQPGNIFVALKDQRDGHEFVTAAFKSGAAAALVEADYPRRAGDETLIRCKSDMLKDSSGGSGPLMALEQIGRQARRRLSGAACVIAVTGSVGKTGTKEMLRACLARLGKVHASEKSYNNHWGVPLMLANMPDDTQFGIFEIGMNHSGEIEPLSKMVRPNVAIITTVEAVHLENFDSVEAIADAKAEIFQGLVQGGVAIIKHDNPHFDRMRVRAEGQGARVVSFGLNDKADVYADELKGSEIGADVVVRIGKSHVGYHLAIPGKHIVENSLAVVAALDAVGADLAEGVKALAILAPPGGRGARLKLKLAGGQALLIDESYNANPASMRAALATLAVIPREKFARRIAVLGDMWELGPRAAELHCALSDALQSAGVDKVFACGPLMKGLYDAAPAVIKGGYAETALELKAALLAEIKAGDAVMVKGSNGMRLAPIVEALRTELAG